MSTLVLWTAGVLWVAMNLFWFAMGYVRGRFNRWWFRSGREALLAAFGCNDEEES